MQDSFKSVPSLVAVSSMSTSEHRHAIPAFLQEHQNIRTLPPSTGAAFSIEMLRMKKHVGNRIFGQVIWHLLRWIK